jgi:hypothetical protein
MQRGFALWDRWQPRSPRSKTFRAAVHLFQEFDQTSRGWSDLCLHHRESMP